MAYSFRAYYNGRSIKIIEDIIRAEDLDAEVKIYTDALGDTIIEVTGDKETIKTVKDIFNCVY